ncbi:hypothetical protein Hte_004790 [Hypoxylon texense]
MARNLRNDFSVVLNRLDGIDEALVKLSKLFAEPRPLSCSDSNFPREHVNEQLGSVQLPSNALLSSLGIGGFGRNPTLLSSQHEPSHSRLETPNYLRPSADDDFVTEKVELEQGERAYKYPASMALLKSISKRLTSGCHVGTSTTGDRQGYHTTTAARAMMLRQLECFPFEGKCLQPIVSSDSQTIIPPPQLITRLFVDGYLRDINTRIPIFDERHLRDAVDTYYSGASHPSSSLPAGEYAVGGPWSIIFNNIVLLELDLETQVARWPNDSVDISSINPHSMTEDLFSSFLRNCDRAIADLTPFTRPSILHVQSLLTLALVAREFYSNTFFERILQTACHVGRMLGLHLSKAHGGSSSEDPSEREHVFRVLYVLDKQRAFLSGDPCDLYHFDSDLELWNMTLNQVQSPGQRLIAAIDDMMIVWEEVYLRLYSARAMAAGAPYLSTQVAGLMQLLGRWHEHHPGVLDTVMSTTSFGSNHVGASMQHSLGDHEVDDMQSLQLEMNYCYHVTHVLILRCERSRDGRAQTQMCHHARTCLRLIIEMGTLKDRTLPTPGHRAKSRLALLGRVLGTYPIVAFTDLITSHLDEIFSGRLPLTEPDNIRVDLELLNAILPLLQGLRRADRPSTYLNRLQEGLEWATRVLEETRNFVGAQGEELFAPAPGELPTGPMAASTTGGCGFYGLDNWQDFFTQEAPDLA